MFSLVMIDGATYRLNSTTGETWLLKNGSWELVRG